MAIVVSAIQVIILQNLLLLGLFCGVAQLFNMVAGLRARSKVSRPIMAWRPGRHEWRQYLKKKAPSYLMSLVLFLAIFTVLSTVFSRISLWTNLGLVLSLIPGLAGYILIVVQYPNRYTVYPEGITISGWLYFNTSRRGSTVTEARSGFYPWERFTGYHWDENILLLKTKFAWTELVVSSNKGQLREILKERFKETSKAKKQKKPVKEPSSPDTTENRG